MPRHPGLAEYLRQSTEHAKGPPFFSIAFPALPSWAQNMLLIAQVNVDFAAQGRILDFLSSHCSCVEARFLLYLFFVAADPSIDLQSIYQAVPTSPEDSVVLDKDIGDPNRTLPYTNTYQGMPWKISIHPAPCSFSHCTTIELATVTISSIDTRRAKFPLAFFN